MYEKRSHSYKTNPLQSVSGCHQVVYWWNGLTFVKWLRRAVVQSNIGLTYLPQANFKCIFLNENDRIPIRFSLKFVPMSPIYNEPAMVQIMAWRRTGDKPLSEPMLTHFTDAYMRHWGGGGDELKESLSGSWRRYHMNVLSTLLAHSAGNLSPADCHHNRLGMLSCSLLTTWTNCQTKSWVASDLVCILVWCRTEYNIIYTTYWPCSLM